MRRLQKIRSTKSQLLRDVIIGQNIGDFSLSDQDLKDVICMNYTTPIHKIFEIHQKYRGYEARIPR